MKLYHYQLKNFEFVIWAKSKSDAAQKLGHPKYAQLLSDQTTNKNLVRLVPDKTKQYHRDLKDDSAEWQIW